MGIIEGELKNLMNICIYVIVSLIYCYYISSRVPKGLYRFISLLPIFSLFTILPLSLSYAFPTAITTLFITWLANFKLLLFSFDQGPLSSSQSLPIFISTTCLPIKINHNRPNNLHPKPTNPKKLPLNLATQTILLAILMGGLHDFKTRLHPNTVLLMYCIATFLLIEVLVASSNGLMRAAVGMELDQPSDEPYLATSLQDFWGRRWNLTVTNILRHTVYKPVRSISAAVFGDTWAPLVGVLAGFIVSGLMHELLFYYVTRARPTWEMTSFFVLHGVCVVVEFVLKKGLGDTWRLHWALSGPLTVGFVVITSFWLFFPPLIRSGADVRVIEEFGASLGFIKSYLKLQL